MSIEADLKDMLIEVLAVEEEEIIPSARFFEDLGGESIDLLELAFLCDKRLGIRPDFQKMFPREELEVDADNRLTPGSLEKIEARLPSVDLNNFREDPRLDHIQQLLTVEAIQNYLAQQLAQPRTA